MEVRAEKLLSEGYLIYSIYDIFKDVKEDIYVDASHMNVLGNILMAKKLKRFYWKIKSLNQIQIN